MEIGKRIKEIATSKKVSANELAGLLNKTRQNIYDIYLGRVSVNTDLLEKIANVLYEPITSFFPDSKVPGYHYYTDINQIIKFSKFLPPCNIKTQLIKGLENTKKEGFKLVDLQTREA